jgi:hypothetical protein
MSRAAPHPGGMSWRRLATTHCVNGHEFTPENTLLREEGWRNCRECNRDSVRRYQARKGNDNSNPSSAGSPVAQQATG